ncbi:nucleotidyltransferase family protein [bacterium]|nr:nucleotidyltransferase family protein [bacterium]
MVEGERSCAVGNPVQTKQDVLNALCENRARIRALGVRRIGLFGSFVRGEPGPDSDVDLLVDFEQGRKTFDSFLALSFLLEEAFHRKVELVTLESLSPHLGPHILAEVQYVALAA